MAGESIVELYSGVEITDSLFGDLSVRERLVLVLLASGVSVGVVAYRLGMKVSEVEEIANRDDCKKILDTLRERYIVDDVYIDMELRTLRVNGIRVLKDILLNGTNNEKLKAIDLLDKFGCFRNNHATVDTSAIETLRYNALNYDYETNKE